MLLDYNLMFSNAQLITVSAASTNTIDLSGGSGNVYGVLPTGQGFGEDIGVGDGVNTPKVFFSIITAFADCTTVQFGIQGYDDWTAPVGWTTYAASPAVAIASLTLGAQWTIDIPRRIFGARLPRYLRTYYTVVGGPEAHGSVTSGILLTHGVHTDAGAYPSNFVVGA